MQYYFILLLKKKKPNNNLFQFHHQNWYEEILCDHSQVNCLWKTNKKKWCCFSRIEMTVISPVVHRFYWTNVCRDVNTEQQMTKKKIEMAVWANKRARWKKAQFSCAIFIFNISIEISRVSCFQLIDVDVLQTQEFNV